MSNEVVTRLFVNEFMFDLAEQARDRATCYASEQIPGAPEGVRVECHIDANDVAHYSIGNHTRGCDEVEKTVRLYMDEVPAFLMTSDEEEPETVTGMTRLGQAILAASLFAIAWLAWRA